MKAKTAISLTLSALAFAATNVFAVTAPTAPLSSSGTLLSTIQIARGGHDSKRDKAERLIPTQDLVAKGGSDSKRDKTERLISERELTA
jgi:hypothetical protein